ncbi:hypothetical protein BDV12DRAFT_28077 [Aspergillus spectabilis]
MSYNATMALTGCAEIHGASPSTTSCCSYRYTLTEQLCSRNSVSGVNMGSDVGPVIYLRLRVMTLNGATVILSSNRSPCHRGSCDLRPFYGPSDAYQTPPQGPKEWLFITVLCSTQLFVQGAF